MDFACFGSGGVRGASEMLINGSLKMQAPNCH